MVKVPLQGIITAVIIAMAAVLVAVAFVPIYSVQSSNLEDSVNRVRHLTASLVESRVTTIMAQANVTVDSMSVIANIQLQEGLSASAAVRVLEAQCDVLKRYNRLFSQLEIGIPDFGIHFICSVNAFGPGYITLAYAPNNYPNTTEYQNGNRTGLVYAAQDASAGAKQFLALYPVPDYPAPRSILKSIYQDEKRWGPAYPSLLEVAVPVGAVLNLQGLPKTYFAFSVLTSTISQYFLESVSMTKNTRVCLVDVYTGFVIVNNWGENTTMVKGELFNFSISSEDRLQMLTAGQLQDERFKKSLSAVGGEGVLTNSNLHFPFRRTVEVDGERVFVDIFEIEDGKGLHLHGYIAIPETDFNGNVSETSLIVLLAVVGVTLLAIISVLLFFRFGVTNRFQLLCDRMKLTASLKDARNDYPRSAIAEVAEMEESYITMRDELTYLKSFLPQSLLDESVAMPLSSSVQADAAGRRATVAVPVVVVSPKNSRRSANGEVINNDDADSDDNEMIPVKPTVANPLGDKSATASSPPSNRLLATTNDFSARDCVLMVVSIAYREDPGTKEYRELVHQILTPLIHAAKEYRGVVESMRPDQVILSFGARRPILNPTSAALRFTANIREQVSSSDIQYTMLLDRGRFYVGVCGSDSLRHETLFSDDIELLLSLGPLVHAALVPVCATGRIAASLTENCLTFPIDSVQWTDGSRVHLYAVHPSACLAEDQDATVALRQGFSLMCTGDYAAAAAALRLAGMSAMQSPVGLENPDFPSGDVFTERPRDVFSVAYAIKSAATRLRRIAAALLTSQQTEGDLSGTSPYARRFVGWPDVSQQSVATVPMVPRFQSDSQRDSTTTPVRRLTMQLEELDKLQRRRSTSAAPAMMNNNAPGLLSHVPTKPATASLVEQAFTVDMDAYASGAAAGGGGGDQQTLLSRGIEGDVLSLNVSNPRRLSDGQSPKSVHRPQALRARKLSDDLTPLLRELPKEEAEKNKHQRLEEEEEPQHRRVHLNEWQRGNTAIGRGAFGEVYRAIHDNGSIAAMKILSLRSLHTYIDELRKELVVAANQRHENLVSFVDAEVTEDEMCVIMELMPGGSLDTLVKDFGRLQPRVVRRFAIDILRGLSHLHRSDIVHCDVKPHNVLVGVDGVCKLADFGCSVHPQMTQSALIEDGTGKSAKRLRGTPRYMAPEVARGDPPSPASDVWSFGIMIHELVSGTLPFNAKQRSAMSAGAAHGVKMLRQVDAAVADAADVRAPPRSQLEGSPAAMAFVDACLRLTPAERPTCDDLLSMDFLL